MALQLENVLMFASMWLFFKKNVHLTMFYSSIIFDSLEPYRKSFRSYIGVLECKNAVSPTPINKLPITQKEWTEIIAHENTWACIKELQLNCLTLKRMSSCRLYSASCSLWKAVEFPRSRILSINILHITTTQVRNWIKQSKNCWAFLFYMESSRVSQKQKFEY